MKVSPDVLQSDVQLAQVAVYGKFSVSVLLAIQLQFAPKRPLMRHQRTCEDNVTGSYLSTDTNTSICNSTRD